MMFAQKSAIITGAGTGIGFEIARQLAAQGAKILLNDQEDTLLQDAVAQIREEGGTCEAFCGDAGDIPTIQAMVELAVQKFGRLDFAIANAGLTTFGDFLTYSESDFQRLVSVNLQGSFFLAQRAARQIIAQKTGGRILLMSSVTGHQYHPNLSAYSMSKAAIRHLAKNLGVELAPYQITVNALSPGATLTERTREDAAGEFQVQWERTTPLGKCATVEDIAHAALFLLSPQAGHITSQTLVIDGGWTAKSPPPE